MSNVIEIKKIEVKEECEHQDHEHFVCMDCGAELDVGALIDAAEYGMDR